MGFLGRDSCFLAACGYVGKFFEVAYKRSSLRLLYGREPGLLVGDGPEARMLTDRGLLCE